MTTVPGEGFRSTGRIRENILVGRPSVTKAEVVQAAKTLGMHPLIEPLQQGYETPISYRGSRLAAGEKQLVSRVTGDRGAPFSHTPET